MNISDWIPPVLQRKASDITKLMVSFYAGQPIWTPRNYEDLAKHGFEANVWVYRCIMAVAEAAAGVDWVLYRKDSKGNLKEVQSHALLDLLQNPNEFMSKKEFIETVTAFMLLSGNSYIEKNGPKNAPPRELYPLRPDRMRVIPDKRTFIGGYEYDINGYKHRFDASQVIHMKYFNPLNDFYGLSPIGVAGRGIDNDNAANAWNTALLQNGARPSGAMVTPNTLSDTQYNQLKNEIDTNYKGASKAGKFMLLEGGLEWKEMGLSPRDMDFINSKKISRVEICAAFGVPPEIVGDKEHATYSNYQEARQSFYTETVLPTLDRVRDKLNAGLVRLFDEKLYLNYDKDGIEALQEGREILWSRILEAHRDGLLTRNEGREALGYEATDGGDIFKEMQPAAQNEKGLKKKGVNLTTPEQKTMYWKSMDRRRSGYYKSVADKVADRFKKERAAVLQALKNEGGHAAVNAVTSGADEWHKLLTAVYIMVMQDFGNTLFSQLKSQAIDLEVKEVPAGDTFNVYDRAVQDFIASTVAEKVVQVTDVTKEKIRKRIAAGEAEGESIPELAARIDELYLDQIIPNRSTVIARTEVIGASNAGNRYAAKQTDLDLEKEWISTRDERTRDSHIDIDGETRNMDDSYSIGVMFPGDPSGAAHEIIQCRCTEGYSVKQ